MTAIYLQSVYLPCSTRLLQTYLNQCSFYFNDLRFNMEVVWCSSSYQYHMMLSRVVCVVGKHDYTITTRLMAARS